MFPQCACDRLPFPSATYNYSLYPLPSHRVDKGRTIVMFLLWYIQKTIEILRL